MMAKRSNSILVDLKLKSAVGGNEWIINNWLSMLFKAADSFTNQTDAWRCTPVVLRI